MINLHGNIYEYQDYSKCIVVEVVMLCMFSLLYLILSYFSWKYYISFISEVASHGFASHVASNNNATPPKPQ